MKWLLTIMFVGCVFLIPFVPAESAPAEQNSGAWSIAGGYDPIHGKVGYLEVRYFGQRWEHWSAYVGTALGHEERGQTLTDSLRTGADFYQTWLSGRLITGLGITYARPDLVVGTPLRYQLRFGLRLKNGYSMELVHESNCKTICNNSLLDWIPRGTIQQVNFGYNFLVLRRRF